jgi:hypothetical protein
MGEPRGRRQVAVGGIGLPALELGKAPPALGLEDAFGSLDLVEVAGVLVRERAQVLGPELVECGPDGTHDAEPIERVFGYLWTRSHVTEILNVGARPAADLGQAGGIGFS